MTYISCSGTLPLSFPALDAVCVFCVYGVVVALLLWALMVVCHHRWSSVRCVCFTLSPLSPIALLANSRSTHHVEPPLLIESSTAPLPSNPLCLRLRWGRPPLSHP